MKRILLAAAALCLVLSAIGLSGTGPKLAPSDVQIETEARNPWTNLRFNNAPETFHFAVVSDRTGGHRGRVFSQAVEQLNLLQPAFVLSVGDLIEGYTKDKARMAKEWKEFQTYVHRLQMPFFYVPGNHDVANAAMTDEWKDRFGRRYYHFVYRDVLFLACCSDDPAESDDKGKSYNGKMSTEQIAYFQKVLAENKGPGHVVVCVHKPLWTHDNLETNGWLEIEKALQGRNYTVFAGHVHRYQKFVRQGMNYYQLATTGGGSRLRGMAYGEFDQIAWITMKKDGPVIANILLDGIYPEDLRKPITDEEGVIVYNRKPTHPVTGKITFDGAPAANAQVMFWLVDEKDAKKATRVADAFIEADGSYTPSTYQNLDGLPVGDYRATVALRQPFFEPSGKLGANRYPERYSKQAETPLTATVKSGPNVINFDLAR